MNNALTAPLRPNIEAIQSGSSTKMITESKDVSIKSNMESESKVMAKNPFNSIIENTPRKVLLLVLFIPILWCIVYRILHYDLCYI
jgi:hypothetical protein